MNSLLMIYLSLSVSGALAALAILLLRPLLRGFSMGWQYYIWLVVVVRLLAPLGPEAGLTNRLFHRAEAGLQPQQVEAATEPEAQQAVDAPAPAAPAQVEGGGADAGSVAEPGGQSRLILAETLGQLRDSLWVFWLVGGFALLVKKVTGYRAFLGYIKAGCRKLTEERALDIYRGVCGDMKVRRPPPLYVNGLAAAPMLVGVFRPFIVLRGVEAEDAMMENILRHELTHYRRGDIYYKWLAQLAVCLHWFNPLAYVMLRQVNVGCELSCDEAVIRRMDEEAKFVYGETLLTTIKPDKGYSNAIVSITLNEDTRRLKERLDAIMNHTVKTRITTAVSVAPAAVLVVSATWFGAYAVGGGAEKGTAERMATYTFNDLDAAGYLAESKAWQNHLRQGEDLTKEWPEYIAYSFDGNGSGHYGTSLIIEEDTTVLVTVHSVSGSYGISIEKPNGTVVQQLKNLGSGQYRLTIAKPDSTHVQFFNIDNRFTGSVLVENITGRADAEAADQPIPAGAANVNPSIPDYLDALGGWGFAVEHGIAQNNWPRYIAFEATDSYTGDFASERYEIPEATTAVLTVETVSGTFGLKVETPSGKVCFDQRNMDTGRFRIPLEETGSYVFYYYLGHFGGRMLLENEAWNTAYAGLTLPGADSAPGDTPYASKATGSGGNVGPAKVNLRGLGEGASDAGLNDTDRQAIADMELNGTWGSIAEWRLPDMTPAGVEKLLAVYLEKHLYPGITPPEVARQEADTIAVAIPYMGEEARDTVVAIFADFIEGSANAVAAASAGGADVGGLGSGDDGSLNEADREIIRRMEGSGTWGGYVDQALPYMTSAGVEKVVAIYLERHLFPRDTTPSDAKKVAEVVATALKYMDEDAKKSAEAIIAAYY